MGKPANPAREPRALPGYLKLPDRQWPQRKACRRAFDLVGCRDITELVDSLARQIFQVVKLANVHALLDQQVAVGRLVEIGLGVGIAFWMIYRFLYFFFNVASPGERAVQHMMEVHQRGVESRISA